MYKENIILVSIFTGMLITIGLAFVFKSFTQDIGTAFTSTIGYILLFIGMGIYFFLMSRKVINGP
jgi:ascorbate-specific PTS system EIIC-type component UlaA